MRLLIGLSLVLFLHSHTSSNDEQDDAEQDPHDRRLQA